MIVLNDLKPWEIQAIVDFMYKGEISVDHEQLASLMSAAESLQVRAFYYLFFWTWLIRVGLNLLKRVFYVERIKLFATGVHNRIK